MLRDVSMDEISDGKKYTHKDLARLSCNDCMGCSSCCEEMGDTIILDPLDVYRITKRLNKPFTELLGTHLALKVVDGIVMPSINMDNEVKACAFLVNKRCAIHDIRPGFCRLFPLGRAYEDDGFYYFLQKDECKVKNRGKVRIDKWIGESNIVSYEAFTLRWHKFIVTLRNMLEKMTDEEEIKALSISVLNNFYIVPFDERKDFYEQVYERIENYPNI